MSLIFFDTETTGLSNTGPVYQGHRVVEVAALLCDDGFEYQEYQSYINPQCQVSEGAFKVHGLSNDFLSSFPLFDAQVDAFLKFITGHTLIAHNAAFDVAFLNYELQLLGKKPLQNYCVDIIDTLVIARKKFPGQKNSLDALCQRFQISLTDRKFHGALKDCHLLQKVYRFLHGGQRHLILDLAGELHEQQLHISSKHSLPLLSLSPQEHQLHEEFMAKHFNK